MKTTQAGSRRRFLLGAGTASAAAAAVVATRGGVPAAGKSSAVKPAAGRGYQLTEHVRNYYRTTAV